MTETKDININVRIPQNLYDILLKRVDELKMTQSEYVRTLLSFETGTQLLEAINIEGLEYKEWSTVFGSVEELIEEKKKSLWLEEKLLTIQRRLKQRIDTMNYLESSIKKTLKAKQRKPRRKKTKV